MDTLIKMFKKGYSFIRKRGFDFLMLYTNRDCSLNCIYCYGKEQNYPQGNFLSFDEYCYVIDQAKILGARTVLFGRVGEPLSNEMALSLIEYVYRRKMKPVVCTNGVFIDAKMADFLYRCNANVIIKLDSLNSDVQSYLAGKKAYMYREYAYYHKSHKYSFNIPSGLYFLLKRGFSKNFLWPYNPSVIGHTVLSKINKPYLKELITVANLIGLKIILQPLRSCDRVEKNKNKLLLTQEEYEDVYKMANEICGRNNQSFQENQKYFFCIGQRPIIDEFGNMVCFLRDRYSVGNIREESLQKLWDKRIKLDDYKIALRKKYACHNTDACPLTLHSIAK